jgi:hypothetical protein
MLDSKLVEVDEEFARQLTDRDPEINSQLRHMLQVRVHVADRQGPWYQ